MVAFVRGAESGWPRQRKGIGLAKEDEWGRHSPRPPSSQSNWSTSADSELATVGSHDFETESSLDEKRSFAVFSSGSNNTRSPN